MAHQTDAPGLARHDTEPRADFNAIFLQQPLPRAGIFRPIRDPDAVQRMQRTRRNVADSDLIESGSEALVHLGMSLDPDIQTLFQHNSEGLMQGVGHVDRGGVMVDATATPTKIVFSKH